MYSFFQPSLQLGENFSVSALLTFLTSVHPVLCIIGCLAVSLAPMIEMPVESLSLLVTTQTASRHCQMSPAGNLTPADNHLSKI